MSTAPSLSPAHHLEHQSSHEAGQVFSASDQAELEIADQDECVVNPLGGTKGALAGMAVGAILWAGIILASAILVK